MRRRAFLSRGDFFKIQPFPTPHLPPAGFQGVVEDPRLGELRTWAVCSFLPFREEKKKSFHYLVFDSDDSFLF